MHFSSVYRENIAQMDNVLMPDRSFDLVKRRLLVGGDSLTMYYINGFVKDDIMEKLMQYFIGLDALPRGENAAEVFLTANLPYVEARTTAECDPAVTQVLSGGVCMFGSTFGGCAVLIDARTYPLRSVEEPESDRVMRGARDGFVETLLFNTALLRRRLRDPDLRVEYHRAGRCSRTDLALVYVEGKADADYVKWLGEKIDGIDADYLPMGHASLIETLIPKRWYNPFPKVRSTERPDSAAAAVAEGKVILLCDNSPEAMILPTCIFDFLQEAGDCYFAPTTGSYLRILRHIIFWMTLFFVPLWYLFIREPQLLPRAFSFILPEKPGEIPILAQIYLTELMIDGLKLASMNTPNLLANSLSVVGGLILGDFAVQVGWLCPEVILYMAFVTIANFTQTSYELGYAVKFMRMILLALTALFGGRGLLLGLAGTVLLVATNATLNRKRNYLYPLLPWNGKAMLRLLVRMKKKN